MDEQRGERTTRRKFLAAASALVAGIGGCARRIPTGPPPPEAPPATTVATEGSAASGEVKRRRLGRTGLEVGVIGMGSGSLPGPKVMRRGITQGLNYIDTSMCYGTEETVGQAIKGLRDEVVLATKWDVGPDHDKAAILAMLDASLRRLGTDRIDVLFLHQLGDHPGFEDEGFNRLDNPALYEAMEQARADGKARYFGASSHVGNRRELLERAVATDAFDVILVSFNHGNFEDPGIPELLALCREKDIGVVGMKVTQGNHQPPELAGAELDLYQAQLRWALEQGPATVINTRAATQVTDQDKALAVARGPIEVSARDRELLERYTAAVSAEYCRGCAQHCESACPEPVRIADVLRYRMYHVGYGDTAQAVRRYNAVPPRQRLAAMCGECNLCTQNCPYGLPVVEQLYEARALLSA